MALIDGLYRKRKKAEVREDSEDLSHMTLEELYHPEVDGPYAPWAERMRKHMGRREVREEAPVVEERQPEYNGTRYKRASRAVAALLSGVILFWGGNIIYKACKTPIRAKSTRVEQVEKVERVEDHAKENNSIGIENSPFLVSTEYEGGHGSTVLAYKKGYDLNRDGKADIYHLYGRGSLYGVVLNNNGDTIDELTDFFDVRDYMNENEISWKDLGLGSIPHLRR